jgi:hypothetical protein
LLTIWRSEKSGVREIYHALIARFCKRIDAVPCASGGVGLQLAVLAPLGLPGAEAYARFWAIIVTRSPVPFVSRSTSKPHLVSVCVPLLFSPRLSNTGLTNNEPFRHVVDGRANSGGGSNSRRRCFYHTGLKKHRMAYSTLETES